MYAHSLRLPSAPTHYAGGRAGMTTAGPRPVFAALKAAQGLGNTQKPVTPPIECVGKNVYPDPDEEREASHTAFMHALTASRPRQLQIPGLQEFAAAVWDRSRTIPSQAYTDPLDHIFTEFDTDNDGQLSPREIARALQSRGVKASTEQVQTFIESMFCDRDHIVERQGWADFVYNLAVADLKGNIPCSRSSATGSQDSSSSSSSSSSGGSSDEAPSPTRTLSVEP